MNTPQSVRLLALTLFVILLAPFLVSLLQDTHPKQKQEIDPETQRRTLPPARGEKEILRLIQQFWENPSKREGGPGEARRKLRLYGGRALFPLVDVLETIGLEYTPMRYYALLTLTDILSNPEEVRYLKNDYEYDSVINTLRKVMLEDPDERLQQAAAEALMLLDDRRTVDDFLKALEKPWTAGIAARALGRLKAWHTLDTLIGQVQRYQSPQAAWALGEMPDPRSVPALLDALLYGPRDPMHSLRREAARALVRIGDPRAEDAFLEVLNDEDARWDEAIWGSRDPEVRIWAMRGLVRLRSARAVEPIMAILANEANTSLERQEAAWTLAELGAREAIPLLEKLQPRIGDPALSRACTKALMELKRRFPDPRSLPPTS
jgi:HEAT repeat protein